MAKRKRKSAKKRVESNPASEVVSKPADQPEWAAEPNQEKVETFKPGDKPVTWINAYFTGGKCYRVPAAEIAERTSREIEKIREIDREAYVAQLVRTPAALLFGISKGYVPWSTIKHKAIEFERNYVVVDLDAEWDNCPKDWSF